MYPQPQHRPHQRTWGLQPQLLERRHQSGVYVYPYWKLSKIIQNRYFPVKTCFTENPPYSLGLWATKSSVTGGVGQGQSLLIGNTMSVPCQPVLLLFPHQNHKKTFSASPCFHLLSPFLLLYFFFCQRELYPLKAAEFTSPWKAKLAFAALQLANCLGEQAVNSALELSCCLPNNEQM